MSIISIYVLKFSQVIYELDCFYSIFVTSLSGKSNTFCQFRPLNLYNVPVARTLCNLEKHCVIKTISNKEPFKIFVTHPQTLVMFFETTWKISWCDTVANDLSNISEQQPLVNNGFYILRFPVLRTTLPVLKLLYFYCFFRKTVFKYKLVRIFAKKMMWRIIWTDKLDGGVPQYTPPTLSSIE